jgi:mannitol-1-phosphate/altronate dehydrogenase
MVDFRNDTLKSLWTAVRIPEYDRSLLSPGIVHVGVGNFHRVHQAPVMKDCLKVAGEFLLTAFGFIVAALKRRRAAGLRPFTVVCYDNLRSNGDTTRRAVVSSLGKFFADLAD